jgi:uracil-DNA glycosylase family 4
MDRDVERDVGQVKAKVRRCRDCELWEGCSQPVAMEVGRGTGTAAGAEYRSLIAVIGEAPGITEDRIHRPFVGPSGQMIRGELAKVGIDTREISWLNAVSCYPRERKLKHEWIEACGGNLREQVGYLRPKYCLVLGTVAVGAILGLRADLGTFRGYWWEWDHGEGGPSWCMSTWHPAAVIRAQKYGGSVARTDLTQHLMEFGLVAKSGMAPTLNEWCVKCKVAVATERVYGLGFCWAHTPMFNREPDVEQLELGLGFD